MVPAVRVVEPTTPEEGDLITNVIPFPRHIFALLNRGTELVEVAWKYVMLFIEQKSYVNKVELADSEYREPFTSTAPTGVVVPKPALPLEAISNILNSG